MSYCRKRLERRRALRRSKDRLGSYLGAAIVLIVLVIRAFEPDMNVWLVAGLVALGAGMVKPEFITDLSTRLLRIWRGSGSGGDP